jgi:transcriptional/translational regulatory protein YebC/TACO1
MTKNGGTLGASGCVSWMFQRTGVIESSPFPTDLNREEFELLLIDAGAEDISWEEGGVRVFSPVESFEQCLKVFHNLSVQKSEITLIALDEKEIHNVENAGEILELIELLEEDEDVDEVFTNAVFPDEVLKTLSDV